MFVYSSNTADSVYAKRSLIQLPQLDVAFESAWPEVKSFVLAEWNITRADRYAEFMGNEGTFASELECIVAAKLNQLNLAIYRRIGPNAQLQRILYSHFSSRVKTGNLLFSGRNDYGHYDVLLPT
ncbi:unnamed protein product [Trichogramma brassicae]|uniref:OTU domain-containing protein n=1 Tax=Trichogramma brassicae TaxID=86971 RepID=A0A6H5I2U3_9HYME|nr:unnamed protein product [Trichogramma brassicae]